MIFSCKMEKDIEIYVDPEEDEVFFGCISEKEKNLYSKLETNIEKDSKNQTTESFELNIDEKNNKNILMNDHSAHKEIIINDPLGLITFSQHKNPVETEHNYSTSVKPKIDKSILTTPKSIVKADKDGGFLKILSEIALVKAEADGEKEIKKRDDENKENKIVHQIPEIRVTEATPERTVLSPPGNNIKHPSQCKIIYKSLTENKLDQKSHSDSENEVKKDIDQVLNYKRKSFDLIDFECLDDSIDIKLNENIQKNKKSEDDTKHALIKLSDTEELLSESSKDVKITIPALKSPQKIETPAPKLPSGLRFSKEARKILEVLKKSTFDDSLNFTVAEIDLENEENSFDSPESIVFDEKELLTKDAGNIMPEKPKFLCKTVEKECHRVTPLVSQKKVELLKHFSERKIYYQPESRDGNKKCVKKLQLEDKKPSCIVKEKGLVPSKIPLFGMKNTKIPLNDQTSKPFAAKPTSGKTPTIKMTPKNPKFNHIESPINAYIHNKQTALMVNVKSEQKKNIFTGIPKLQTTGSEKKANQTKSQTRSIPVPEKPTKLQCANSMKLPFVEYKSATTYKIEKVPESRLPRLSPSVQKLIGTRSPRVLKHEGRFYLTTPRKANSTENSTIIADPKEVSVVISQSAQKSNTIK